MPLICSRSKFRCEPHQTAILELPPTTRHFLSPASLSLHGHSRNSNSIPWRPSTSSPACSKYQTRALSGQCPSRARTSPLRRQYRKTPPARSTHTAHTAANGAPPSLSTAARHTDRSAPTAPNAASPRALRVMMPMLSSQTTRPRLAQPNMKTT